MKSMHAFLLLAASMAATPPAFNLPESAARALRQQLEQMTDAALREDDDAVVRAMYPRVVQAMGGTAQARRQVEAARLGVKSDGATVLSSKVGAIRGCAKARKQIQCVVEGTLVMRVAGGRLHVETDTVAFSGDGGANWTFFAGGQDPAALRAALPELSLSLPLRPRSPPKFERE